MPGHADSIGAEADPDRAIAFNREERSSDRCQQDQRVGGRIRTLSEKPKIQRRQNSSAASRLNGRTPPNHFKAELEDTARHWKNIDTSIRRTQGTRLFQARRKEADCNRVGRQSLGITVALSALTAAESPRPATVPEFVAIAIESAAAAKFTRFLLTGLVDRQRASIKNFAA